ncbi:MAG: ABC transporter ATP-binding protein/permease [Deltaproteobacteria bacterium]|jgi:ATP-binding cassette subfamily B protein|nr:ABC transporter ATP-binding protein/permease [Deltaproteobacteria bacterium]
MKSLGLIKPNIRASLFKIITGFLALFLCDLLQMVIPRLTGRAIDLLADSGTAVNDLGLLIAVIMGLALTVAVLRYSWRHLIYGFSRGLEKDLRRRLHSRFLRLSLTWHQNNSSGDLMALATNDIESVRMAIGFGSVSLMDGIVMGLAAIIFMLSINPALCFYAFLPMPLISVLTKYFGRAIYVKVLETHDVFGQMTEVVREQFSGIKVIRAMSLEKLSQAEVDKISLIHLVKNVHLSLTMGLFFPLMILLTNLALALTLYLGGRAAMAWTITPGDFVAFITYLALLSWPMMALGLTLGLLQQGQAALDRLARVMLVSEKENHPAQAGADLLKPDGVEIAFKNVSFAYQTRPNIVLDNLTLTCPRGRLCALTGPTGSGKSTLAALLPALYEPSAGQILINGRPTTAWPIKNLRDLFGYVPQDGYIFTGTLAQNMAIGKPEATEEEVTAALVTAGLPPERSVFPEGLETLIGEKGLSLSGGQRQRLALARAVLMDPLFLILDDTLSAVDAAVEDEILNRLIPQRKGRGTLIISHRLTSLKAAETVFILENGRLTGQGTPRELEERPGYFQTISRLAQRRPGPLRSLTVV